MFKYVPAALQSYIVDNKELLKQSNGFYGFFFYSGNFQQILIGTGDRKYVSQQIWTESMKLKVASFQKVRFIF